MARQSFVRLIAVTVLSIVAIALIVFVLNDIANDRTYVVIASERTPICKEVHANCGSADNPAIDYLVPGEKYPVLRIRWGKLFANAKVSTPTGSIGWVFCGRTASLVHRSNL